MRSVLIRLLILNMTLGGSLLALDHLELPGTSGPGVGKRVVLIAGDEEYRSEESLPMLAKILSQRHGFTCTVLFPAGPDGVITPADQTLLSQPAALDHADAIILLLRYRAWKPEAMAHFTAAYRRGVPLIALRTSTHAFRFPDPELKAWNFNSREPGWIGGFGKQVLGETWVAHHGKHGVQGTRSALVPGQEAHPLLRGIGTIFGPSDVYAATPPADATILLNGLVCTSLQPDSPVLEGPKNTPPMPIAWCRERPNEAKSVNRILTTTMGAATDLADEGLRRLIVNGIYWGLRLEVPPRAEVEPVDAYHPARYGFKTFRTGLRVADLALGKNLPPPTP